MGNLTISSSLIICKIATQKKVLFQIAQKMILKKFKIIKTTIIKTITIIFIITIKIIDLIKIDIVIRIQKMTQFLILY